jgi:membrane protein implicated in regulation of membrane protease activity
MMLMTAVAWIYVVGLMALTEPSIVAGVMTFVLYCVIPLSILFYLTGSRRRKRKAARIAELNARAHASADDKTKTADT